MTTGRHLTVVSRDSEVPVEEAMSGKGRSEPRHTGSNVNVSHPPLRERDAARYIGMSVPYLRQARMRARGPAYYRIGRSIRYGVSDLDAWLSTHRVTTRDQAA